MGLSDWNKLVKETFAEGKKKDNNYTLKQAMQDASKKRKSGNKGKSSSKKQKGGSTTEELEVDEVDEVDEDINVFINN